MGIFDDIKKQVVDSAKQTHSAFKQHNMESKASRAPIEGAIIRYGVTYLGGLPQYAKKQSGEIGFNIMPDSFYLKPTTTTESWFEDLVIPYEKIQKFEIVTRTLTTSELMMTSDARALEQDNNIEITFTNGENETVLRIEMLTGTSVAGQAIKCKEMLDVLRNNNILKQLNKNDQPAAQQAGSVDVLEQLEKLGKLKDANILSEEEFNAKKTELLSKL